MTCPYATLKFAPCIQYGRPCQYVREDRVDQCGEKAKRDRKAPKGKKK